MFFLGHHPFMSTPGILKKTRQVDENSENCKDPAAKGQARLRKKSLKNRQAQMTLVLIGKGLHCFEGLTFKF